MLWALARLHTALPGEGWDAPARRISEYLVTERDDAERRFPPVSDHWGSYALAEMAAWPSAPADGQLTDDELAYARRQAGLFGVQARYESQRRDRGHRPLHPRPVRADRRHRHGGRGARRDLAAGGPGRRPRVDTDAVGDRLVCVAGMLVDRQAHSDDPRTDGAWFRLGVTQVDDEQHAISALLAALPVIEERS